MPRVSRSSPIPPLTVRAPALGREEREARSGAGWSPVAAISIGFTAPLQALQPRASGDTTGGTGRPPRAAVDFVERFNLQLGLGAEASKEKVEHMASDPTHFFTAMPALFYQDLRGPFATASQLRAGPAPTGLLVGDAHLENLKTRTSDEGKTVWGWGDTDKAGVGPIEWDLDRLAAHTVLSARAAKHDFSRDDQKDLVDALAKGYTQTLRDFAETGERLSPYLTKGEVHGALDDFLDTQSDKSQRGLIKKKARHGDLPKSQRPSPAEDRAIRAAVADYVSRLPRTAPIARPVEVLSTGVDTRSVGGSNSGLTKYLVVLAPADPGDPQVLIKFKQVLPSPVTNGTGNLAQSNAAQSVQNSRVLEGTKDPLLGYATINGRSCVVEPEQATSGILDPTKLGKKDLLELAERAGQALARSQLNSSALERDKVKTWLGNEDTDRAAMKRLEKFAMAYADQTEADTKALK